MTPQLYAMTAPPRSGAAPDFDDDGFLADPDRWTAAVAAQIARDARVGHLLFYHVVPPTPLPGLKTAWLAGVNEVFAEHTLGQNGTGFSMPADSTDITPID